MSRLILFFFLISLSAGSAIAQKNLRVTTQTLSTSNNTVAKFHYGRKNEPPRAIEFKERTVTSSSLQANIHHHLKIPTEFSFIETESSTDKKGMNHAQWQQLYKGIPIEGMGYRVHQKGGFVTSINGKAAGNIKLNDQTTISEEQAFDLAVNHLHAKDKIFRHGKKLIVSKGFTFSPESFSLAFQFDISVSLIEQWRISINAHNGEVINKVSLINNCFKDKTPPLPYGTGTGLSSYYGNRSIQVEKFDNGSSRLVGQTKSGGKIATYNFMNASVYAYLFGFPVPVYDIYSSDNTYNYPGSKPAVSVQWAAEQAYEYYFQKHNRDSYDNNGSQITCYVHVDQNMDNAFWGNKKLLFGDGSHNNPLVELDVVSHELTHGVTENEAGLQYYGESGALNESFSDILGKSVEFYTFGDSATWQLARHYTFGGIRDMSNPNLRLQPNTYLGNLWYTGYEDQGGVHTNSGVQNFWFYLLCKGGSGINDRMVSYSVKPVGLDTAADIVYRNLTEYLGYSSDYLDSRIGSLMAVSDLYGKNSNTYQQVVNAWDAVGVIAQPIIQSAEVYDITATTARIRGSFIPQGDTVTYHFEYGTSPDFGSSSSIYKYTDKVEGIVTGLQPQTKYYLRLVATNENGSSYGYPVQFTTISLAPLVQIKQTADVTETTATLYGRINPNSLATSFYFEYGPTSAFGLVTPTYQSTDTTEYIDVSAPVVGLQSRQTYYYRLVATNGFSSASTESASFFTAVRPVINSFSPISGLIGTEITIAGNNFNPTAEKNLIRFGATNATIVSSSMTEIKVKVPVGASLGPITILDAESGLIAESVHKFAPTFTGDFKKGDLQLRVGTNDVYAYQTLVDDMDGDGKPDIVVRHYLGFSVYQNVNQGGDITNESFIRNTFPTETSIGIPSLIDFDGNGLKDLVASYNDHLRIYPNYSVPGYIFFGAPVDVPIELSWSYTYKDFDGDGHIDIAASYLIYGDSTLINIYRNQNPKGFLLPENFVKQTPVLLHGSASGLFSDDLDNDGKPDLIGAGYNISALPILINNSQPGLVQFTENHPNVSIAQYINQYVIQDLNQDGMKDITLLSSNRIADLDIVESRSTYPTISLANPIVPISGSSQTYVGPGDINGDGKIDLMVSFNNRKFIFLKNDTKAGDHLSQSSFEEFEEFGTLEAGTNSGEIYSQMTISDLNGDGRPDVVKTNAYSYGPHDGYQMEIWQNSTPNCLDPSLITVSTTYNTAQINLPPNTTLDQFLIEYSYGGYNWSQVNSTTLYLSPGYPYQLRVRSKCYLGYSDYYLINFQLDCVDVNGFSIGSPGDNSVFLIANNIGSFEIQYSLSGQNQWIAVPQYANQILGLQPGTMYDLRYRGRCNQPVQFHYLQFTTLCPSLSSIAFPELTYNRAKVKGVSLFTGKVILEYSEDNETWTLIDETGILYPLVPGKQYYVRGKFICPNSNSDFIYTSLMPPCPIVSLLKADDISRSSAKINWVDESKTNRYLLSYCLAEGGPATNVETDSTSFFMNGLDLGTQYSVAVAANCLSKPSYVSLTFKTNYYKETSLSPNPTTNKVTIYPSKNLIGNHFAVYDNSGSVLVSGELFDLSIDLTNLATGIYTLKIDGEKGIKVVKY